MSHSHLGIPLEHQRSDRAKWRFLVTVLRDLRGDLEALETLVMELAQKGEDMTVDDICPDCPHGIMIEKGGRRICNMELGHGEHHEGQP